MIRRLVRHVAIFVVTLLIGGFLGCVLLRYAPGFDSDERDVDPRFRTETVEALRQARAGEQNVFQFYYHYLAGASHGDFGMSRAFERPVSELIAARAPITLRLIAYGLVTGWLVGLSLAVATSVRPFWPLLFFSEFATGLFLCFPAAILALFVFLAKGPVTLVIAAAIFPRVYRYSRAVLLDSLAHPAVLSAASRGIPRARIFFRYAIPPVAGPLIAFLAVCVTIAFGAAIPVEVICDLPGIGHLAWKAATGRDLPLLTALTLIVTAVTLLANAAADMVPEQAPRRI
jgi:peptide/nickel transport system permease protein